MNFTIKTYSLTWEYKKTISPNIVKNNITFNDIINGGLWQLSLQLNLPINNTDFLQGDQIKIWKWTYLLYNWYIDEVNLNATSFEEIILNATWVYSLLTRLYYNESWDFELTKTGDPAEIIDEIIDFFNTKYSWLSKETENTWTSVSYDIEYSTLKSIIDDLVQVWTNYFWHIDQNGIFKFQPKPTTATHKLTFEKNIFSLDVEDNTSTLVNKLYIRWSDDVVRTYEDITSQNTYWIKEKYLSKTTLSETASDEYWNSYIEEYKNPQKNITLTVDPEYTFSSPILSQDLTDIESSYTQNDNDFNTIQNIETVKPWEMVNIRNISKEFWNLLITKKQYNTKNIILYLDWYTDLISLIKE